MVLLCFLATAINYIDRANLGVAAPIMREELNISPEMMGLILGCFFSTYAVMQLPMGYLVDRFGPRLMYTVAVAWWSVFTALMAVANSVIALFGYRLLLGAGEAGAYPSNAKVTALGTGLRHQHLRQRIAGEIGAIAVGRDGSDRLARLAGIIHGNGPARLCMDRLLAVALPGPGQAFHSKQSGAAIHP
jgi:MFS family permease